MSRLVLPSLLTLPFVALFAQACGGGADALPAGAAIEVRVDGEVHRFEDVSAELQSFLGGSWLLDVSSGQGSGTDLSFAFFTDATTAGALSGRSLENDYREHNPDRHPLEDILNFVRVGAREYQGHHVTATVRSVSDTAITLEIGGTFLDFPRDWDESDTLPIGREVDLSAVISVPLRVEAL